MSVLKSSLAVSGEFQVAGLSELYKLLDELPSAVVQNAMRGAMRAGANVIAEEARRLAPADTGQLKASIRLNVRISNGKVYAFVKSGGRYKVYKIGKKGRVTKQAYRTQRASGGFDYHAPFYAHFVEFGTAKMRAKPFMRPAFDIKGRDAVNMIGEYLSERLPAEISKLKRS